MPKFDLTYDTKVCPPERNALKEFYESSKGHEWSNSSFWLDEYEPQCSCYGVTCNQENNTIKLKLENNGLSGTISKNISGLSMLEHLDLSDNDMKVILCYFRFAVCIFISFTQYCIIYQGSIPIELGLLSNLAYLRLNHNDFVGNETTFEYLDNLKLIHLQGNRLSGSIPIMNMTITNQSSFIADCGDPSHFDTPLICKECTMCCKYPTLISWRFSASFNLILYNAICCLLFRQCPRRLLSNRPHIHSIVGIQELYAVCLDIFWVYHWCFLFHCGHFVILRQVPDEPQSDKVCSSPAITDR